MGRIILNNEKEWLAKRAIQGIGGSECASCVDANPYMSKQELYAIKTGAKVRDDISGKDCVQYGKKAESYLRELFILDFPEYKVNYHEFDIFFNDKYPFVFATLDGELTDLKGRHGILEVKTTEIHCQKQWEEWTDDTIPQNYYCQVLHQLLSTLNYNFEFVVLKAQIKYHDKNGKLHIKVNHYFFERSDMINDMQYLLNAEIDFNNHVQKRIPYPVETKSLLF